MEQRFVDSVFSAFEESDRLPQMSKRTLLKLSATFLCVAIMAVAGGCGYFDTDDEDLTRKWTAQKLYTEAKSSASLGDYETAIDYYQKLEARYPFGPLAEQGQLELAYAYYRHDEPDSAVSAADRFIKLHPRHDSVAYAYYLKGLVNFNRTRGFIHRIIPPADHERDIGAALDSFKDFSELVNRFPESKYSSEARKRMLYLRNTVAEHELVVARYYLRRSAFVAAVNRAKYVVENFPTTPSIAEALTIMVQAYRALELHDLADDAVRVLKLNHPDTEGLAGLERRPEA
ncbi:MAG: outer membrane protein assembly factor BamD [Gammaproteobacteria bacterium]